MKVPKPEFYVLYIGKETIECEELFTEHNIGYENATGFTEDMFLQIRVKNIDIHYDKLSEVQRRESSTLAGYSYLIQQFGVHEKELKSSIDDENKRKNKAMLMAIEDCRSMGYLLEYLDREEFKVMLEKEYTMADYIESLKEDIRQQALEEGLRDGRQQEREEGIKNLIVTLKSLNIDKDNTLSKIVEVYHVPSDKAEEYLRKYLVD